MQPPSGSVPTLPMPPFLTSVSPTSTVHGIKANWAEIFLIYFLTSRKLAPSAAECFDFPI
jgi:hypothetical protein